MATQTATSVPSKRLAVSILSTDASFKLNNILSWSGIVDGTTALTSADFGTRAFGVFRNSTNTQLEFFEWDPTTVANASITIISRALDYKGGTTANFGVAYNWNANETIVEHGSHSPQLFEQYLDKTSAETISGVKIFAAGATPQVTDLPVNATDVTNKGYVDNLAFAGAPDGADAVKGLYERATQAEIENGTAVGSTTAPLAVTSGRLGARLYTAYAADAGASDSYIITCAPVPTQYSTGMVITFKANTANTGACTVNVNSLGIKSFKVNGNLDPQDNYIKAGQIVTAIYDGTNFQIQSVIGKPSISQSGEEIYGASSSGNDTYAISVAPIPAAYATGQIWKVIPDTANTGTASLNVNALGAKTIKKIASGGKVDLETGDLLASQPFMVMYDGTDMVLISQRATPNNYAFGKGTGMAASSTPTATTTETITLTFKPKLIKIYYYIQGYNGGSGLVASKGIAFYNATTLTFDFPIWGTDGATGVLTTGGDRGYPSTANAALIAAVGGTNVLTSGNLGSNNGAQLIVTMNAVGNTGFTLQYALTIGSFGTAGGNALFDFSYEAFA